jgi:GAF domain-containing protein
MKQIRPSLQLQAWSYLVLVAAIGIGIGFGTSLVVMSNWQSPILLLGGGSAVILGVALIGWRLSKQITAPLKKLPSQIKRISESESESQSDTNSSVEMRALVDAIRQLVASEKTTNLEAMQKLIFQNTDLESKIKYLEIAALISRTAVANMEFERLVHQVAELLRTKFSFYYVGLYLLDEAQEWVVLYAGTGKAGQTLLEKHHRVRVGEGMVGMAVVDGELRFSMEMGKEAVHLATPELPLTRAEATLPLVARGRIIGALSVQSEQAGKFDKALLNVLQMIADFIALSIDNSRHITETEEMVSSLQSSLRQLNGESWIDYLQKRSNIGYIAYPQGLVPVSKAAISSIQTRTDESKPVGDQIALSLPLVIHGKSLGVLQAIKPHNDLTTKQIWTDQELSLLEGLTEQLTIALDNARLYESVQRNAERERILSDISSKVWSETNVGSIMKTAIHELAQALRIPKGSIELHTGDWHLEGEGGNDEE